MSKPTKSKQPTIEVGQCWVISFGTGGALQKVQVTRVGKKTIDLGCQNGNTIFRLGDIQFIEQLPDLEPQRKSIHTLRPVTSDPVTVSYYYPKFLVRLKEWLRKRGL